MPTATTWGGPSPVWSTVSSYPVVEDAVTIVKELLRGGCKIQAITLDEVQLNDGQRPLAVNDFFIGVKWHGSRGN
jgi:hypothetical protein